MTRTSNAPPSALLAAAAKNILAATRRAGATDPVDAGELTETGWQLVHLTGSLAELAAILADDVSRLGEQPLRDTTDTDPRVHRARACLELSSLRHALERGETAAREYYTAISHLSPVRVDTTNQLRR